MSALYLAIAIVSEVVGTMNVKISHGFTRWQPSLIALVCYAASTYLLSLAVRRIEVSVAYAIWAAVGTALIAALGAMYFKEAMTPLKVASLCLIVVGVVGLNLGQGPSGPTAAPTANREARP